MILQRKYWYLAGTVRYTNQAFYIDRNSGHIIRLDEDMKYADEYATSNLKSLHGQLESQIALKNDGTVLWNSFDNNAIVPNISNVVWAVVGGNLRLGQNTKGILLMITNDHRLYAYGVDDCSIFSGPSYRAGSITNADSPTEIILPDNEVPFMCSTNDTETIVVTMKGNVYYVGSGANVFEVKSYTHNTINFITSEFRKLPITNVVWAVAHNSTAGDTTGLTFLKRDGSCWTINKQAQITKVLDNILTINGADGDCVACDIYGNAYLIKESGIIDLQMTNAIYGFVGNEGYDRVLISDINGRLHFIVPGQEIHQELSHQMKDATTLNVPNDPIKELFVSTSETNSRSFYIKTTFTDQIASDYSRNVVNYV